MPELFRYEELRDVLNEVSAMSTEDLGEVFRSWGVDPDELKMFLAEGVAGGLDQFEGVSAEVIILSAAHLGFFLGFKTCLEIETRKTANG